MGQQQSRAGKHRHCLSLAFAPPPFLLLNLLLNLLQHESRQRESGGIFGAPNLLNPVKRCFICTRGESRAS